MFKCKYNECNARCCRHTRLGSVPYDFSKERSIHFLVKPEDAGISVMNWERDALLVNAKKQGIALDLKPLSIAVTNKGAAVISWFINHDACPFVGSDDKCRIYVYRPLTCRFFPLMLNGISTECPYTKWSPPELFGDSFTYFKAKNLLVELYSCIIEDLVGKGVVKVMKTSDAVKSTPKKLLLIEDFVGKDFGARMNSLINEPVRFLEFLRNFH